MRKIAKITIIFSIFFNLFLFGFYFWALTDKIQNPEFKNLPLKEYLFIGIGLIVFAIINVIFARNIFQNHPSSNIHHPS